MEASHPPFVRTRLSIMMFLQFFIWGSWGVAITGYADNLGFAVSQIGWLGAIPAIGAIISPLIVGPIADRFFPAQRVLSVLHLVGGGFLILAAFQGTFLPLLIAMLLNGLAFMPTLALVNSVTFTHIPDANKFPRIAVLGTVGWIVANLSSDVFLGGTDAPNFLFQAGIGGIVLGLYALTLPNTPPKGGGGGDVFGLSALKMFRESSFLIFIVCVFLLSIPACGYFFTLMTPMFQQRGYPAPLALGTLNQFAEIIFMFTMPWFVAKLGLKRVLMIGMGAWALRYLFFASPMLSFPLALVGLVLHGFCYSFFYVGAYMYVDRRAPAELKTSAQSLLAFLMLGVGFLIGAKGAGFMMAENPPKVPFAWQETVVEVAEGDEADPLKATRAVVQRTKTGEKEAENVLDLGDATVTTTPATVNLPPWRAPASAWDYLNLSGTVNKLLTGEEPPPKPHMASVFKTNDDGEITMAKIKEQIGEDGVTFGEQTYSRDDMVDLFKRVAKAEIEGEVAEDEIELTRTQWLSAQSCNWTPIWLWPSIFAFVVLGIFAVAFHDKPEEETAEEETA